MEVGVGTDAKTAPVRQHGGHLHSVVDNAADTFDVMTSVLACASTQSKEFEHLQYTLCVVGMA